MHEFLKKNEFKVSANLKQSKKIQNLVFRLGGKWRKGTRIYRNVRFLFIKEGNITFPLTDDIFISKKIEEVNPVAFIQQLESLASKQEEESYETSIAEDDTKQDDREPFPERALLDYSVGHPLSVVGMKNL